MQAQGRREPSVLRWQPRRRHDHATTLAVSADWPVVRSIRRCALRVAPSGTTPRSRKRHRAISSLRARATIMMRLRRPVAAPPRVRNRRARAVSGCQWSPQPGEFDGGVPGAPVAGFADALLAMATAAGERGRVEAAIGGQLAPVAKVAIEDLAVQNPGDLRHDAAQLSDMGDACGWAVRVCQSAPSQDPGSASNSGPHWRLSSGRPRSPWRGAPRASRSALTSDGAARVGRRCGPPGAIRGPTGPSGSAFEATSSGAGMTRAGAAQAAFWSANKLSGGSASSGVNRGSKRNCVPQ